MCIRAFRGRASWALVIAVFVAVLLFASVAVANPYIEFATPGYGGIGDIVAIIGTGFGTTPGQVIFRPGDLSPTMLLWSDTSIICYVPAGAVATSTVQVSCAEGTSNAVDFWVYNRVWGYVYDGHGTNSYSDGVHSGCVQDAKVELKDRDTDEVLDTTYTKNNGEFLIEHVLDNSKHYRLTVTLESKDKNLVMKRDGTTVSFSRDFTWSSTDYTTGGLFPLKWKLNETDKIAEASTAKGDIDNCAAVWHWTSLNRAVAKIAGRDITTPLTVSMFDDSQGITCFSPGANTIRLMTIDCNDDDADHAPAPWVFQKNRESHEFGHAVMWAKLNGWPAPPSDKNHSGYVNTDTGDSLTEGFAEYWSTVVDELAGITGDPAVYDNYGRLDSLGTFVAWTPLNTSKPMDPPIRQSDEEFAAAALMRDLGGAFGGGVTGLNTVVDATRVGGTLTSLRNVLVGSKGSTATIDARYYNFGFFSDLDADWVHDAGEPVGAGNGVQCVMIGSAPFTVPVRLDRQDHPKEPNDFVGVKVGGVTSATAESTVTLTVEFPLRPSANYTVRIPVSGSSGLVHLPLQPDSEAHLSVTCPSGAVAPQRLDISYAQWSAAKSLVASGAAITATFTVDGTALAPTSCTLLNASSAVGYAAKTTLVGYVQSSSSGVAGAPVWLQTSADGTTWVNAGSTQNTMAGGYFTFVVAPEVKTYYRVAYFGNATYAPATSSPSVALTPQAYVRTPAAPSKASKAKSYTVYGYLKPRHASGMYPVKIYKYRKVSGKWKSYGYVKAKASNYSSYTKYSVKMRLSKAGKWRLRAFAPADSGHTATWSSGYDYVTVR